MSKTCGQCQQPYRGFGTVCAACRRAPAEALAAATPREAAAKPDHCVVCKKRVYAMEQKPVEGMMFHKDCFKCTTCERKLDGNFGKNELGFFCLTHFHEIAKLTGGYKSGTGPTRNAVAAGLVDALVHRRSTLKPEGSEAASTQPEAPASPGPDLSLLPQKAPAAKEPAEQTCPAATDQSATARAAANKASIVPEEGAVPALESKEAKEETVAPQVSAAPAPNECVREDPKPVAVEEEREDCTQGPAVEEAASRAVEAGAPSDPATKPEARVEEGLTEDSTAATESESPMSSHPLEEPALQPMEKADVEQHEC
jgi:hypothetical protein